MIKSIGPSMVYDGRIGRKSAILSNELTVDFLPNTVFIFDDNLRERKKRNPKPCGKNQCECCLVAVALALMR